MGYAVGGFLNATFGNAVELIVSVYALQKGFVDMVQGSLLGSILSNLLLVLGMCFLLGGFKHHTQYYNADGARVQVSLMVLAVLALAVPSMAGIGESVPSMRDTDEDLTVLLISIGGAVVLAFLYVLYLIFQLWSHPEHFRGDDDDDEDEVSLSVVSSVSMLIVCTLLVAMLPTVWSAVWKA